MKGMRICFGSDRRVLVRCTLFVILFTVATLPNCNAQSSKQTKVVIVDPTLPDVDLLLSSVEKGSQIVILRKTADPIATMTRILKKCSPVSSLHLFLEGRPGVLVFGNTSIDITTIDASDRKLSEWRQYFVNDADIFLYGCEIGRGAAGLEFIRALAMSTGLDVAASDNMTGSYEQGGDWFFEVKSGTIGSEPVISEENSHYPVLLRKPVEQTTKKEKRNSI